MKKFKMYLQHAFNPLHVYCRLTDLGMRRGTARRLCLVYERILYCHVG